MKTLESIFKIYGISKVLVRNHEKLEFVVLERNQNLSLNRWINLINSIKYSYKKEVEFLLLEDAKKIYGDLESFSLLEVKSYE